MRLIFFILVFLLLTTVSCKKKTYTTPSTCLNDTIHMNSLDTIQSSEYLMAYPGSWWKYSDGSEDSCTSWQLTKFTGGNTYHNEGCPTILIDQHYLPYHTRFGKIYNGKRIYTNKTGENTITQPLIEGHTVEEISNISCCGSGGGTSYSSYKYSSVKNIDFHDELVLKHNTYYKVRVIRCEQKTTYPHVGSSGGYSQEYYFAHNVGLVKAVLTNDLAQTKTTILLVDHYIAPH